RTFTLIGVGGALAAILTKIVHPLVGAVIAFTLAALLVIGFARDVGRKDTTSIVAAVIALSLGLLAGAGQMALAIAAAAVMTLILASRRESHRFVACLNATDVQAFARFA